MKKLFIALLCLLFVGLCACGGTPSELVIYSKVIRKYKLFSYANSFLGGSVYHPVHNYALYDIDSNGTKELLVGSKMYPSLGDDIALLYLYTIRDEKAVDTGFVFWDGSSLQPLLFQNGTIKTVDAEMDWISYYRFEGDELKLQVCLEDHSGRYEWWLRTEQPGDPPPPYITVDPEERTPLTQEEFERLREDMEGDGQVVEIDWKPLKEYKG